MPQNYNELLSRNQQGFTSYHPKETKTMLFLYNWFHTIITMLLINIFMPVLSNETMEFMDSFDFLQDSSAIIINTGHKASWGVWLIALCVSLMQNCSDWTISLINHILQEWILLYMTCFQKLFSTIHLESREQHLEYKID